MKLNLKVWAVALLSAVSSIAAANKPEIVPDRFLVMLSHGMERPLFDTTMGLVRNLLGANSQIHHEYFFSDFRGFAIEAPSSVMNLVRNIAGIQLVQPDTVAHTSQNNQFIQSNAPYGLDRISHRRSRAVAGRNSTFIYYLPAGKGTTIYVIDSGVRIDHVEFQGRASKGQNYAPPNVLGNPNDFNDYTGHGTHVASIAAGYNYGVAKFAQIIDVKVINDNGTTFASNEVAGIAYAVNDAQNKAAESKSVLQMSFGGFETAKNSIVNYATRSATQQGLFCSVAAGNNAVNSEALSPGNTPEACTAGATDINDNMATFSNYGDLVDIWAPGVDILGALAGSNTASGFLSGTSMASPFVAGVAATLKSFGTTYTSYAPVPLCNYLRSIGSTNYIKFRSFAQPPGPNILLYDNGGA